MTHLTEIFDLLDQWRHFPAYQLERRADIFFALYLHDLLAAKFGIEVAHIIPEFPIRIGSLPGYASTNQSFKVDYLIQARDGQIVLLELKTDHAARRSLQDAYLEAAVQVGMQTLLAGLTQIVPATQQKRKYMHLLRKLQEMGLIEIESGRRFGVLPGEPGLRVVYLQPVNPQGSDNILSFREAAQIIRRHGDELSVRFAQSLEAWAARRAGED